MSVEVTFHGSRKRDDNVQLVDVLPGQQGDSQNITSGNQIQAKKPGIYYILGLVDCRVRIGAVNDDANKGEKWPAGKEGVRYVDGGQYITVGTF